MTPDRPAGPARHALVLSALAVLVAGAPLAAQTRADSVDALPADGRIQEAAWAARAAGDTLRADSLLVRLDSILRSQPRAVAPLSMDSQGVSYTFRLDYGGGVAAIFKVDGSDIFCRSCGADREVAVYRIDRFLGADLVPMTVPQRIPVAGDTVWGSAMYFVRDAAAAGEIGAGKPDRLRLFDAIIGNSDRHGANWLVMADGGVVAIDHNRAFEYHPTTKPKTCWESEIDALHSPDDVPAFFDRYRTASRDSLAAAVAAVRDPELRSRFVDMRDRVVARLEARVRQLDESLPRTHCPTDL